MSAPRAAAPQRVAPGSSAYVWEAPGRDLAVQIDLQVLERLAGEAYAAYKLLPKRGAEVGGVLLGYVDPQTGRIVIQDHEPVPCRYCSGPSYTLSGSDEAAFREVVRRWAPQPNMRTMAVGFYRSHTRARLFLDDADVSLLDSTLPDPKLVVLLVRPNPAGHATGGFLFRVNGDLEREYRYPEFPFGTASSAPASHTSHAAPHVPEEYAESPLTALNRSLAEGRSPAGDPSAQAMLEAARALPWTAAPPPRPSGFRWQQILAPAAVLIALVLFFLYIRDRWPQAAQAPPSRIIAPETSPLGLKIAREQPYLRLNWDQAADAVLNAVHGALTVSDGVSRRDFQMDVAQLRGGSIAYAPVSDDVTFRLEIFLAGGRSISESIRIIGALPAAPGLRIPLLSSTPPAGTPTATAPARAQVPRPDPLLDIGRPAPRIAAPVETAEAKPPAAEPADPPTEAAQAARPPETPAARTETPAPAPQIHIAAPPQTQPPQARTTPDAPVGEPQPAPAKPESTQAAQPAGPVSPPDAAGLEVDYVGPKPVRSVRPAMSPTIRRLIDSVVQVDINVAIDATGKVTDARPTRPYKGISGYLAQLAAGSARMWRFSPATRNNQPVPSEYLLRFEFRKGGD